MDFVATLVVLSLCLVIAFPIDGDQSGFHQPDATSSLTGNHHEAWGKCSPRDPIDGIKVVVSLELGGHHLVGIGGLVMEV